MIINEIRYNFIFSKVKNIRRLFEKIEKIVETEFETPINIIPIPDDAPPEIPRYNFRSVSGLSNVSISSSNLQLSTKFDENFNRDFEKCITYSKKKLSILMNVINDVFETNLLYSGASVEILYDDDNPTGKIVNELINKNAMNDNYDVEFKFVKIVDNMYYANYSISNSRNFFGQVDSDTGKRDNISMTCNQIKVFIDVNDRYAYNSKNNYLSNISEVDNIIKVLSKAVHSDYENFIKEMI